MVPREETLHSALFSLALEEAEEPTLTLEVAEVAED
jgi:hypothetical protein